MSNTDKALNLMSTKQRRAWELLLAGKKQREIAGRLGISQPAVAQRLRSGKDRAVKRGKMLRKCK